MTDRQFGAEPGEDGLKALFACVEGLDLDRLPAEVRRGHAVLTTRVLRGHGCVERGSGLLASLLCRAFGFPPSVDRIEVEVIKHRIGSRELWQRRFGQHRFHSSLRVVDGRMRERFGAFEFEIDLQAVDGALLFPVRRGWLLGLRLPQWLLPHSVAREYVEHGRLHFDVALVAPLGIGRLVRYRGSLDCPGD